MLRLYTCASILRVASNGGWGHTDVKCRQFLLITIPLQPIVTSLRCFHERVRRGGAHARINTGDVSRNPRAAAGARVRRGEGTTGMPWARRMSAVKPAGMRQEPCSGSLRTFRQLVGRLRSI
ncbi:hypothetical protein BHE74_00032166 [Ensete ventricosum]|nr:hypothetical protein GW17_00014197 [Ensete ventricosum]RWW60806.1 hypothetical protein BHE74_00032166 [Ensete ventricosum]RZR76673.1 hypothetical protein BHM03_00001550 [Ensete ventricosum]